MHRRFLLPAAPSSPAPRFLFPPDESLRPEPGSRCSRPDRSALRPPDPATSPYADALFTTRFAVLGADPTAPARISLLLPGFFKRTPDPASAYRTGDLIEAVCVPLDQAGPQQQSIQQADDLGDVDLPVFLALETRRIDGITRPAPSGATPAPPSATIADMNEYKVTAQEELAREKHLAGVREELARLEIAHGGWDAWRASVAPLHAELKRKVAEAGGVLKKGRLSLSDLAILDARFDPAAPESGRMIQSLLQLQTLFREGGAHFILAPFPDRALVAAPRFLDTPPPDGIVHPDVLRLQAALLDAGIEMLEVQRETLAGLGEEDFLYFYDSPDPHPAEGAVRVMARALDERLRMYDLPRGAETFRILHKPYRGPVPFDGGGEREAKRADRILEALGAPLSLDTRGRVLFLGDSFLESPAGYGAIGTGLAYQFAYLSGSRPGVFERKSGAFHMLHYVIRQSRTVFPDRKVAVMVTSLENLLLYAGKWTVVDPRKESELGSLQRGVFPTATPLASWSPANRFREISSVPAGAASPGEEGLSCPLGAGAIRITLPLPPGVSGRGCLACITLKSSAYADATIRSGDSSHPLTILKGDNRLLARFDIAGESAVLELPPGGGTVLIKAIDLRLAP
ncbi:MAG: hypothetical protein U1G05_08320 [Kiritimatiellia bacterium]